MSHTPPLPSRTQTHPPSTFNTHTNTHTHTSTHAPLRSDDGYGGGFGQHRRRADFEVSAPTGPAVWEPSPAEQAAFQEALGPPPPDPQGNVVTDGPPEEILADLEAATIDQVCSRRCGVVGDGTEKGDGGGGKRNDLWEVVARFGLVRRRGGWLWC